MKQKMNINGQIVEYEVLSKSSTTLKILLSGKTYQYCLIADSLNKFVLKKLNDGTKTLKNVLFNKDFYQVDGVDAKVLKHSRNSRKAVVSDDIDHMVSPMPGKILDILVKVGDKIKKADPLLIMIAMKMEHTIKANKDGIIKKIHFSVGDQVDGAVELIEIE